MSWNLGLSGTRVTVRYRLHAVGRTAARMAERLCLDQTVEASGEVIPRGPISDHLIGRVESLEAVDADGSAAAISFPIELFGRTGVECLHLLYGTSSLKPNIKLIGLEFPTAVPLPWPGPRFGRTGVRTLLGIPARPLTCAVLKPLGLTSKELAALASQFAHGGVDWVKDDQGMTDHPFCPFEDRVAVCAEAIAAANRRTGGACRYVAHISTTAGEVRARAALAKRAGAGGLMICPGLTGYDIVREISADDAIGLPVFSHPALLGTYALHSTQGIAPSVLYGLLPRLMGADVSIYPTWGPDFGLERSDCLAIAAATASDRVPLKSIFPTAAGRIGSDDLPAIRESYGNDVMIILGSRIQRDPDGIVNACLRVKAALEQGT